MPTKLTDEPSLFFVSWSWQQDSNPQPDAYKTSVLPIELCQPVKSPPAAYIWKSYYYVHFFTGGVLYL